MILRRLAIVGVAVALLGWAAVAFAGEHARYVRGTGLSGLGNPCCGRAAACCPVCGSVAPCSHSWCAKPGSLCAPRAGLARYGLGHGHGTYIQPGPPTAAITYPYYTLRGPRDFLQSNPTPIGP